MRSILNKLFFITVAIVFFAACKKDEAKVVYQSGTAPSLTATVASGDTIPLGASDSTNQAVVFSWTNPDYVFSNGPSSLNVSYNLEIDTTGANFSSPVKQTILISPDLSTTYSVGALNSLLSNAMLLATGQTHNIQVRITSFLGGSSSPQASLNSNILNYIVTPFAPPPLITPPPNGTLFIVGAAVPVSGWNNPISPASQVSLQQFTQITPTEYKLTIELVGGGEYKLVADNGDYNYQWSVKTQDTYPNGGPFVANGANSIAPAASGTYIIDVNFQTGMFTVTPQ